MNDENIKAQNLFKYLKEFAEMSVKTKMNILKELGKDEEIFNLDSEESIPVLDNIFLKNREEKEYLKNENIFLEIKKRKIENAPSLPGNLEKWVNYDNNSFIEPEIKKSIFYVESFEESSERVGLFKEFKKTNKENIDIKKLLIESNWITKNEASDLDFKWEIINKKDKKIFLRDKGEIKELFNNWVESQWNPWKEKNWKFNLGNIFYKELYSLRAFLKSESDGFDLLWSHDILSWKKGEKEIHHPIFFTPVNIDFDSGNNIISLTKDENQQSYVDLAFIREILNNNNNLTDIDELSQRISRKIREKDFDIWDKDFLNRYLKKIVSYVDMDGESFYLEKDKKISKNNRAEIYYSHNIILQKKDGKNWAEYAKKIQEDIKKNNQLTPFLEDLILGREILSEENNENNQEIMSDNELYFPLPYNQEQKQISKQLDSSYGAIVQGPPGTGKTHTIANLISRFLAQGKTVLVTAQNGQALSVLKDKIPKGIRSMTVAHMNDNSKSNDLHSSVTEINGNLSDNIKFTESKKESIKRDLDEVRRKTAILNNEFEQKSLIDSRKEIIIDNERFTPISAAKFTQEYINNVEFKLLDKVQYNQELSFSQNNIDSYIAELKNIDENIWDFSKLDTIPLLEKLPKIEDLKKYFELNSNLSDLEKKLHDQYIPTMEELNILVNETEIKNLINEYMLEMDKVKNFHDFLKDINFFEKVEISPSTLFDVQKEKHIFDLREKIIRLKNEISSIDELWEKDLLKKVDNENEKEIWKNITEGFIQLAKKYRKNEKEILGNEIKINKEYVFDYIKSLDILKKIEENSRKNNDIVKKGMSILFNSDIKNLIKNIKLNDKEIENSDDILILKAYFNNKKIEKGFKKMIKESFERLDGEKEFSNNISVIEIESFIDNLKRIIYFRENNQDIKNEIMESQIFDDMDISNIEFIKKTKTILDNWLATFNIQKKENYLDKISESFKKENSHEKTLLLSRYIKDKNLDKVNLLINEIKELNNNKEISVEFNSLKIKINESLVEIRGNNNHKDVDDYLRNILESDIKKIEEFYEKLPNLIENQKKSLALKNKENILNENIPKTVAEIRIFIKEKKVFSIDIEKGWKYQRLISWLEKLHSGKELFEITKELNYLKKKEFNLVGDLVEVSSWMKLKERVTKEQRESLSAFAQNMKDYGKGTGKYAKTYLKGAEKALQKGKNAVPVWIMSMDTVSKLFSEPKANMFDVVIFDEASQVGPQGLNIAYIGKKLLIVGDDEQVSWNPVGLNKENLRDLAIRYLGDIDNSMEFSQTSLFNAAKIKMTNMVTLTEHFRSVEEIIGFSNKLSYNGNLKILRNQLPKYRLEPILEPIFVKDGYEETNGKINKPEAEKIVEKIKGIIADEKYKDSDESGDLKSLTIGVVSLLGKDQSKYITKLIGESISSKEIEKRKILCGDPYTFQGDERDIIMLSMVKGLDQDDSSKNISSLTDNKKENKQRINVAMSRAKNKMILFHSIPKDKLTNPNDLRKQIIDWFYNNKIEQQKFGMEVVRSKADSEFEIEVAEIISKAGFRVIPQYEVAGYKIDLVIQGENSRMAIECDGDQYHNGIEKWKEDIERQTILERSGWKFWRVSGSSFYKHKEKALESLWIELESLGIKPN